jgi:hypothetical protein
MLSASSKKGKITVFSAVLLLAALVSALFLSLSGVLLVAAPPAEIIVDNPAATFVGSWGTGTATPGYYGANYAYHAAGTGANTATWSFTIPSAGTYEVFAYWSAGGNRASNAKYTVNYQGGATVVTKNQQVNGGSWQSLATFSFNAAGYSVSLSDNANGYVIADAIRVVLVSSGSEVNEVVVTNTDPIPVDVTGWLHTTQSDYKYLDDVSTWSMLFDIDTTGYRQITFGIYAYNEGCEISLDWYVHDPFSFAYDWTLTVGADGEILYTYDIICDELIVWAKTTGASSTDVWAYYYMTT